MAFGCNNGSYNNTPDFLREFDDSHLSAKERSEARIVLALIILSKSLGNFLKVIERNIRLVRYFSAFSVGS